MSEQVLLVELGAFAPGREVWIPGWHSATYASAKAVSSEQQKLLMLVDECATEALSLEYIEDLELSEVELRMSHRLLKLGVCLVSQDGATLFTVHSDEADSGPALVQVCGAHHVVYKHTATSLADFQWSTVVRLLASVGILRQTRFADCGNVRILPREMVPFIYLPAMSTPLVAAVAANSPVVKLVNADESLIKKFSAFLTEQWVFGFSRHPESLFVFCHEEDAAQFKNKLAYASATIHQGQVAVKVFRFFLGPLRFSDLQPHVSQCLQLVQGQDSTVWHFDWDADGDQTLVEPPLVDSIALAALLGSSVSSERRDVCWWLAAISDFLRNQAAVMTVAAVGQTDALERLKAVLAFCLDHSTFSTIRCLTDHCDQSFRKTKNYCRLFSRNLSELIPQMQHIRFSFAPEVDVTFDVSFRFRPRICELLIDRLCSLPSISGQLLKSSLLQAIYMERLALAMKFVPALTMAPAREGAKVETERQSTGSTKDIEECSNAPAPPGKMGKFKKFTKAISSLFACLPFRKSHISVLD